MPNAAETCSIEFVIQRCDDFENSQIPVIKTLSSARLKRPDQVDSLCRAKNTNAASVVTRQVLGSFARAQTRRGAQV
jgi:hypothetical protein